MTAFNKQRPRPAWLSSTYTNKNTKRRQKYFRHLWDAQPDWADVQAIRAIYRERDRLNVEAGFFEISRRPHLPVAASELLRTARCGKSPHRISQPEFSQKQLHAPHAPAARFVCAVARARLF